MRYYVTSRALSLSHSTTHHSHSRLLSTCPIQFYGPNRKCPTHLQLQRPKVLQLTPPWPCDPPPRVIATRSAIPRAPSLSFQRMDSPSAPGYSTVNSPNPSPRKHSAIRIKTLKSTCAANARTCPLALSSIVSPTTNIPEPKFPSASPVTWK